MEKRRRKGGRTQEGMRRNGGRKVSESRKKVGERGRKNLGYE